MNVWTVMLNVIAAAKMSTAKNGKQFISIRCGVVGEDNFFLDCKLFDKKAEEAQGLQKSDLIVASGRLRKTDYVGNDGKKKTAFELTGNDFRKVFKEVKKEDPADDIVGDTMEIPDYRY